MAASGSGAGPAAAAEAARVLAAAELLWTADEVERAYGRLAGEVERRLADTTPVVLVAMVGGLIPAVELISRLGMQLELDYVHATRYRGGTSGHDVEWRVTPSLSLAGRSVLIVDDILDEGYTLAAIVGAVKAAGAASVHTAVLVEKLHDRRAPGLVADFVGLQVPDRYVFGCGMDYKGWYRQLPAIHALAGTDADPHAGRSGRGTA